MGLIAQRIRTGQAGGMLPIGRYWIDLFGSKEYRQCLAECFETSKALGPVYYYTCQTGCRLYPGGADEGIDAFNAWGTANGQHVRKLKSEEYGAVTTGVFMVPRTWVLFELTNPVEWPTSLQQVIGTPTPAGPEVGTSDDTVQKPPPEKGPLEQGGLLDEAKPWLIGGALLLGVIAAASLARSFR